MKNDFTYIKNINRDLLVKELTAAGVNNLISSIEVRGNILNIKTSRNLSILEEAKIYDVLLKHSPPSILEQNMQARVTAAMQFGQKFMIEFATENIMLGLTVEQIAEMLIKYGHIQSMMLSGSLYTALAAVQAVEPDNLITQERKDRCIKKLKTFLGIP